MPTNKYSSNQIGIIVDSRSIGYCAILATLFKNARQLGTNIRVLIAHGIEYGVDILHFFFPFLRSVIDDNIRSKLRDKGCIARGSCCSDPST